MLKCFIRKVPKAFQLLLMMGGIMLLLTIEYFAARGITVATMYVLEVAAMNNAGVVPWLSVIGIVFGIPAVLISIGMFCYEMYWRTVKGVKNLVDSAKEVVVSVILGALFGVKCYIVYGLNCWLWKSYNQILLWPEVEVNGKLIINEVLALLSAISFVVALLASALTWYAAKQKKQRAQNTGGQSAP